MINLDSKINEIILSYITALKIKVHPIIINILKIDQFFIQTFSIENLSNNLIRLQLHLL